jgi:hypothetical protein
VGAGAGVAVAVAQALSVRWQITATTPSTPDVRLDEKTAGTKVTSRRVSGPYPSAGRGAGLREMDVAGSNSGSPGEFADGSGSARRSERGEGALR